MIFVLLQSNVFKTEKLLTSKSLIFVSWQSNSSKRGVFSIISISRLLHPLQIKVSNFGLFWISKLFIAVSPHHNQDNFSFLLTSKSVRPVLWQSICHTFGKYSIPFKLFNVGLLIISIFSTFFRSSSDNVPSWLTSPISLIYFLNSASGKWASSMAILPASISAFLLSSTVLSSVTVSFRSLSAIFSCASAFSVSCSTGTCSVLFSSTTASCTTSVFSCAMAGVGSPVSAVVVPIINAELTARTCFFFMPVHSLFFINFCIEKRTNSPPL